MSDKWRRSKAWDDAHLPSALWPVRVLLRAFSSITLAVCVLVLVMLYGISASVPVGLMALAPTYLLYALSVVGAVCVIAGLPVLIARRLLRPLGRGLRFAVLFTLGVALVTASVYLWHTYAWPRLRYDPVHGSGVRLFAEFVEAHNATTLRRLPAMEMSELEYYSWWPMRALLLTFVLNMVVATVRRIDFTFKNIGVLTVHTGIITIALGSVYYSGLKQEGDTLLLAGDVDGQTGRPGVGPAQDSFYDNTRVALFVDQGRGWEQRPLRGVPRYNQYNLAAASGMTASDVSGVKRPWDQEDARTLDLAVPASRMGAVDEDIGLRIVGYAPYAEPVQDWLRVEPQDQRFARTDVAENPLRIVYLHSALPDASGQASDRPVFAFTLPPRMPAERAVGNGVFAVEHTLGPAAGMDAARWRDLTSPLPLGTEHALAIEVPGVDGAEPFRAVYPVEAGTELRVGSTGFVVSVKELAPKPPFPIITEGYRGANSSVAVVNVTPPAGEGYERWVYHRFPEISQDMLKELNDRGMPTRRDADPSIRISLIEADQLYVYIDEPSGSEGATRAIVRQPGGQLTVIDEVGGDGVIPVVDKIHLRIGERWPNAVRMERPAPSDVRLLPSDERAKVGTHEQAMMAVEVSLPASQGSDGWSRIVWLPFSRYMGMAMGGERPVQLPDGRSLRLAFGRLQHSLPGFTIELVDFQMIAYDHRGAPRDYQSVVRVTPVDLPFDAYEHVTKLNAPLRAPFMWRDDANWFANFGGALASGMNPNQFKFSQAGWDAQGWDETQQQVDAGLLKQPFAQFTILGVGNNPGIHMIAAGGVLMALGIPWAFYLKPWLVRREKHRIQRELAAGTYRKPVRKVRAIETVVIASPKQPTPTTAATPPSPAPPASTTTQPMGAQR